MVIVEFPDRHTERLHDCAEPVESLAETRTVESKRLLNDRELADHLFEGLTEATQRADVFVGYIENICDLSSLSVNCRHKHIAGVDTAPSLHIIAGEPRLLLVE